MPIITGAVVPHAPVLIDGVHPGDKDLEAVREAVGQIDLRDPDVVVIVSPHGREGVYRENRAELGAMGLELPAICPKMDTRLASALADRWGRPLLGDVLDHGAAVALRLLALDVPVVCVSVGSERPVRAAGDLLEALAVVGIEMNIALVASVNLSAGLTGGAPLTQIEGARDLESRTIVEAIRDAESLAHRAVDLAIVGGSCAAGPLTVFGRLFPGSQLDVLEYRHPFGVGYLVATSAAA